jgi:hypothetical protein
LLDGSTQIKKPVKLDNTSCVMGVEYVAEKAQQIICSKIMTLEILANIFIPREQQLLFELAIKLW